MNLTPDLAAEALERHPCATCGAPAGSACRTRSGNTAIKYHTARLLLVPELRDEVEVAVPAGREPGRPWTARPDAMQPLRIGYAHWPPESPDERQSQLDALAAAQCTQIFSEQVDTRVKARPELDRALALAHDTAQSSHDRPVCLTVLELNRLARNTAELMRNSAALQADGIHLELLTGPLAGTYDPRGTGAILFAVLEAAAQLDREHLRAKTAQGRRAAAAKGNHGGRPKIFDADMLALARTLRDEGMPIPEIAEHLTVKSGKNVGRHPSVASVYRVLAEDAVAVGTGAK